MTTLRLSAVNSAIENSDIDPQKKAALKTALLSAAAPLPDTWIYRIVVLALGLAIFVPLAGLGKNGSKDLVQMLLPIATAALGALAGLLAPSPAANGG
jgi:hypothetical protein